MKKIAILCAGLVLAACSSTAAAPETPALNPETEKTVKEQFLKIDFNGDGLATPYEHKEYRKADFAKNYDTDGDGVLKIGCSKEAFSMMITKYTSHHPEITACYQNDDTSPTEFSFDDFFAVYENWQKEVDLNSDGFISEGEFLASYSNAQ